MKWQVIAVGGFAAWLTLGIGLGALLSPIAHHLSADEPGPQARSTTASPARLSMAEATP